VVSAIDAVPITKQRKVPEGLDSKMQNPGMSEAAAAHSSTSVPATTMPLHAAGQPRANITCDAEHPDGTYTPPEDMTV
jgi:hypothetical protein